MLSRSAKPYIDASVPVLRQHGIAITTLFYKNMFESHPELKNIFNMGNQANGSQQQSLAAAVFAYAANIDNSAALAPVIERIVHKHVSVGIKAEHYPIVGSNLIGAIKGVLGEAATPELLAAWEEAYGLLADALIDAEARLYQQNNQQPDEWLKVKVADKQHQSEDVVTFTLQADGGQVLPKFKPGQYISVAVHIEALNLRQIRQYSLSDANQDNTYRITVKREKGDEYKPRGNVSNWLHQHVRVGSVIDISYPCGNFTPDVLDQQPIGLISAGVGITPMISMVKEISINNPTRKVLFAHAARNRNSIAHLDEIQQAKHALNNLNAIFFLNESKKQHADELEGRMDLSGHISTEFKDGIYYICGPQSFMDDQRDALLELGVSSKNIHREVFGPESLNHII
ncbi:NO-inducible flavohemoprotein [Methylotenera oryzisoli]|uniref:Flavohemoprotein n=1 Tax=Methylotenera oryzisoli TaxID=2080758 RepID=A0A4Y9VT25_9PROT|nr:NO-inducible flavohemoprotein [Methylotenera oryzisoli]TFW71629.1 NO-inducible flavohemoprotein [Methylotenera oryzisoli]